MEHADHARSDFLRALSAQLDAAPKMGGRGLLIDEAGRKLGLSRTGVYAALETVGWRSKRKTRKDRGESKIDRDQVLQLAGFGKVATRNSGKRLLTYDDTVAIGLDQGVIAEEISATTLRRRMKDEGVHPSQLVRSRATQEMRSLHPNHVWQIDPSVCVLVYLPGGKFRVMSEIKFNEKKPENIVAVSKERVLRYLAVDHASATIFLRYFNVAGEDTATNFEFLMWCFEKHATRTAHGVPQMIVWDAGSANKSHPIRNLFTGLAVTHWTHMPGNSGAKGAVEVAQNIVERRFEGLLRLTTRVQCIEDLNAQAELWQNQFCGRFGVTRNGMTLPPRTEVWQRISEKQLRLCPPRETCEQMMVSKPETRIVDSQLNINFAVPGHGTGVYCLKQIEDIRAGDQVEVVLNRYRLPNIWIVGQEVGAALRYFEIEPTPVDNFGFLDTAATFGGEFKSKPKSDYERNNEVLNSAAYGVRADREVEQVRTKGKVAYGGQFDSLAHIEKHANALPAYLPKRGTEMDVPLRMQVELKPLDHFHALLQLKALLNRSITPEENALVAQLYPAGVLEDEIKALAERLTQPATTTRHLRVVS